MAESSLDPAVAADLLSEPTLATETVSKELMINPAMEGSGGTPGSHLGPEVLSSNGDADGPLPTKALQVKETAPVAPESENGTMAEGEKNVLALLRHIETEGEPDQGGDPGKGPDHVQRGK